MLIKLVPNTLPGLRGSPITPAQKHDGSCSPETLFVTGWTAEPHTRQNLVLLPGVSMMNPQKHPASEAAI